MNRMPRPRSMVRAALVLAAAAVVYDLTRPPSAQWTTAAAVAGIRTYQATLAPMVGAAGVRCRFEPTCSHYAIASLQQHGLIVGLWRATRRIARCGPWTPAGTVDPP